MAKPAKQIDATFTDREVRTYVADILDRYEQIESARGSFMNEARRQRDGMQSTYEMMAAKGVPQKVSRTEIKIIRLIERIKKLIAELDADHRKMVEKLAKAQGDKRQLSLMLEVPKPKPERKPKKPKTTTDNVVPLKAEEPEAQGAA